MKARKKLQTWMRKNGVSQAALAEGIDRSRPFVSQLLSGQTTAGLETSLKIESFTKKHVKSWEWVEVRK